MEMWQLGNTTVRSAMRIRDGLTALSQSNLQGNIRSAEGDVAFRDLLGKAGVVSLGKDSTNSAGRKWRSAMGKLGFIYPKVEKSWGFAQELLGPADVITPAGWNLIGAETVPAMQECYLRAMSVPLPCVANRPPFSPLRWTLALLLELDRRGLEPAVSFLEIALVVQVTTPWDGLENSVEKICDLRQRREQAERKRLFDKEAYARFAETAGTKPDTAIDYADMNMRYLKATGMVQSKGKGIALVPEKKTLAAALAQELFSNKPLRELFSELCSGAKLPFDDAGIADKMLRDLLVQARQYGIYYSVDDKPLDTPAHMNKVRYEIENLIAEKKEEAYAARQNAKWREIAAYMDLLAARKTRLKLDEETEIRISKAEAPAYLEWCVWRAFLAIDSLVNKPYQVRQFTIDQDFLPVSTARSGVPDMIAEFENFVIVIEVTLSESSRQEAMEGEPVRRHVADLVQKYQKPVYGLFIANRVDTNTAETFRIGIWYAENDRLLSLKIVPLTLKQFSAYFKFLFEKGQAAPEKIISLLQEGEKARSELDAPQWKQEITQIVERACRT